MLIFHATDDLPQFYRNAEYAASTIPGAGPMRFGRGGHLLLGVELAVIRPAVQ